MNRKEEIVIVSETFNGNGCETIEQVVKRFTQKIEVKTGRLINLMVVPEPSREGYFSVIAISALAV